MQPIYWLILFLIFLVFEAITLGLTTIWFAGGAVLAFILALLDVNTTVQIYVFLITSFVLLFVTRPLAQKYVNRKTQKTNVETIIGKQGPVIVAIDNVNAKGRVKIDGEEWMARTENDGEQIPEGTLVTVKAIEGVKLIVCKE